MVGRDKLKALSSFMQWRHETLGQLHRNSILGSWLHFLCGLPSVRTVVEFGTWSGAGSSSIIAKSLELKHGALGIGLEVDLRMAKQASHRLRRYKNFRVVFGTSVSVEELDCNDLTPQELEWFQQDVSAMESAPVVKDLIPKEFDLCLLDGGEFSSWAEWLLVAPRVRSWLLLDDTGRRKNSAVLRQALSSGDWALVDSSSERDGTAVLKRIYRGT